MRLIDVASILIPWASFCSTAASAHTPPIRVSTTEHSAPGAPRCANLEQQPGAIGEWQFDVSPHEAKEITLTLPPGRDIFLSATESKTDVILELANGDMADNPIRRTGTQIFRLRSIQSGPLLVRARTKLHAEIPAAVQLRAYDIGQVRDASCRNALESIASADNAYAMGQSISTGHNSNPQYSAADRFEFARQQYQKAFQTAGTSSSPTLRASIAHSLAALLYQDLYDWRNAERWATTAAKFYELAGDAYNRSRAEALQAAAWMELATLPAASSAKEAVRQDSHALLLRAIAQLKALAQFHATRGERYDEALQLNNVGLALYYAGSYDAAIQAYRKALPLYAELGERYRQAQVFQNIAVVNGELARSAEAIEGYQHALALLNSEDSPKLYGDILNNCAFANLTAGHLEDSIRQSGAALEVFIRIQDRREQARSLYAIARVYAAAGNYPLAEQFLQRSLEIRTASLDARGRVDTLRALAFVAEQDNRNSDALPFNREALSIATDAPVRVRLLNHIAESESVLGDPVEAARSIELATTIASHSDPISSATVALERAVIESRAGHLPSAYRHAQLALHAFEHTRLRDQRFDTYVVLARIEHLLGRDADALSRLDRALALSEHIRNEAKGSELRAGLMQSLRPAFDIKIDLLFDAFRAARDRRAPAEARRLALAALDVAERYRARAMRDIAGTRFETIGNEELPQLAGAKNELLADISLHRQQLKQANPPARQQQELSLELATLLQKLVSLDSRITSLGHTSTLAAHARIDWTRRLNQLPDDEAVLSYWFTASRLYVWVLRSQHVSLLDLGDSKRIVQAAVNVHAAHRDLQSETPAGRILSSNALSRLIVQPILGDLPAHSSKLVIVPDGALHYVPFVALSKSVGDPRFLVESFDIAYAPSAAGALSGSKRVSSLQSRMLLVSDAIYEADDSRLPAATPHGSAGPGRPALGDRIGSQAYTRLPGTAEEATNIARQLPADMVDRLEGVNATRTSILAHPLETYRYIHFAVHGSTDADIPQLSSIVLSSYNEAGSRIEDHLWAGDLLTRKFDAETIVFSACDTALGKRVAGEGIVGLRYMALARGAHSVVASLWEVPDRITARIMGDFYAQLVNQHASANSALATSMRHIIAVGPRDPALWAAFTVTTSSL